MRKVFIDNKLNSYVVPSEMRNFSKAENTLFTPGTRIPLEKEVKVVRLFTAWSTLNGDKANIDIDLGGAFIKENNGQLTMEPIAYYRQASNYAVHSGDFTFCESFNQEDGIMTAEYIDVDLEKAKDAGFKYVLTGEFIFGGCTNYDSMNAWSGVQLLSSMRTEKKQSVNINDSLFKVKLSGEYQSHAALAIDLETMEIVIMDQYSEDRNGMNVNSMVGKMNEFKKLIFNASEFSENIYDLILMYCEANELFITNDIQSADIIVSYDDYKGLAANQTMFNVSNNLENIINLLNN